MLLWLKDSNLRRGRPNSTHEIDVAPASQYLRLRIPLCCLTSDTHSLSVLLLGHITIPFSREQHKLEIVKEYPSRSNLNSFPEFYEASAERVMNSWSTLDCRHPLSGENHYQNHYYFKELTCSLVVNSHSRFTILSQQVNVLYEFPVSYHHLFYKDM